MKISLIFVQALGLWGVTLCGAWCQTNPGPEVITQDPLAPSPVPRMQGPTPSKPADELPSASGDKSVFLDKLEGLVICGKPESIQSEGYRSKSDFKGSDGVMLLEIDPPQPSGFLALAQSRLNKPVSMLELNTMLREMIQHYRAYGYPVVDAYMPEQAVRNGIIQVVLTVSVVGEVKVEGNKFFKEKLYKSNVRLRPGEPIQSKIITADRDWLNINPFRQVDVVYEKGVEPGTTDIILKTTERRPFRAYTSVDDSGNLLTGNIRLAVGYNWGDVFGTDDQLSYQFTSSSDINALRAHSVNYLIPLPWRHTLTFLGSYGNTVAAFNQADAGAGISLSSSGRSWTAGMRYGIPLASIGKYEHQITLGYDFKQSDSQLLANVIPINRTATDVSEFLAGYSGSLPDKWGATSFSMTAYYSPGGMTSNNDNQEFNKANAGGSGYAYGKLEAERTTKLPADFTFNLRGAAQVANKSLIGSEQMGLGGWNTVRGYDEREANGDNGIFASAELRTPTVSVGEACGLKKASDQLQFLAFFDYGYLKSYDGPNGLAIAPGPNITLASVGPGARYNINPYLSARFDYGWQMTDTDASTITRRAYNSRGHFGLTLSF